MKCGTSKQRVIFGGSLNRNFGISVFRNAVSENGNGHEMFSLFHALYCLSVKKTHTVAFSENRMAKFPQMDDHMLDSMMALCKL